LKKSQFPADQLRMIIQFFTFDTHVNTMANSRRYRFPKIVVTGISVAFIILIILTWVLFHKEPTKACALRFLRVEIFALILQLVLNYINYRSENKIVVLATMFISTMILFSVLMSFFNFRLMCELYPAF